MSERESSPSHRVALAVGDLVLRAGRAAWDVIPSAARVRLEERFFGAIFQVTRVTNDDYGFRPDQPDSGQGGRRRESSPGKEA